MNIRWSILISFCLAVSLPTLARAGETPVNTPQQASNASSFQQELIDTQKAFLDATERGDAAYVRNAVADDFMAIGTNGDSGGRGEVVNVHPPEHAGPKPIFYEFNVVQLNPDCGVVTYNAVFHGAPIDRYQHLSDTWVRQNGQWKLKFQQTTVNLWSAHDLD
jgi:hypothetical protein